MKTQYLIYLCIFVLIIVIVYRSPSLLINFFTFFPDKSNNLPVEQLPEGVKEIFLNTPDNKKLQCYFLSNTASDKLIIFFHGNAGNIAHRLDDAFQLYRMNANVLLVSYRGYGKSTGKASEKGIYIDGYTSLNYATNVLNFTIENIYIYGRSLGSAVAVHIAGNKDLAGLILITPFSSGKEYAAFHNFGFLKILARNSFDSLTKIQSVTAPVLIIHGDSDRVVSYKMGQSLYNSYTNQKKFVTIRNGGHNDLSSVNGSQFWGAIRSFINGS